jgi:hypothetical protein
MEIVLVLLTTALVEGYKWSLKKFGKKSTTFGIYLGILVVSVLWTYLKFSNILSEEFIKQALAYGAYAIATYEVIYKYLLKKQILDRIK